MTSCEKLLHNVMTFCDKLWCNIVTSCEKLLCNVMTSCEKLLCNFITSCEKLLCNVMTSCQQLLCNVMTSCEKLLCNVITSCEKLYVMSWLPLRNKFFWRIKNDQLLNSQPFWMPFETNTLWFLRVYLKYYFPAMQLIIKDWGNHQGINLEHYTPTINNLPKENWRKNWHTFVKVPCILVN